MSTTETALVKVEEGKIVAGQELHLLLGELAGSAEHLVVHDKATCEEALELAKRKDDAIKFVMAAAEPERLRLRSALEKLLGERDKIVAALQSTVNRLELEARAWNIKERQDAKAEQDKLNKGQRAENRVEVKPNLPSVPGKRIVLHYRCEVLDASKVKRDWMVPDVQAIERQACDDKDPAKTEKAVGGVRIRIE